MNESDAIKNLFIVRFKWVDKLASISVKLYDKSQEFRFIEKLELDERLGNIEVGTAFPLKEIYEYRLKIYTDHINNLQLKLGTAYCISMAYSLLYLVFDFYSWGLTFVSELYKYYSRYGIPFENHEISFFFLWYESLLIGADLTNFFLYREVEKYGTVYIPPGIRYFLPIIRSVPLITLDDKHAIYGVTSDYYISKLIEYYTILFDKNKDLTVVFFYCFRNFFSEDNYNHFGDIFKIKDEKDFVVAIMKNVLNSNVMSPNFLRFFYTLKITTFSGVRSIQKNLDNFSPEAREYILSSFEEDKKNAEESFLEGVLRKEFV